MPMARISPGPTPTSYCCALSNYHGHHGQSDCLSSGLKLDASHLQRLHCFSYHCNNNGQSKCTFGSKVGQSSENLFRQAPILESFGKKISNQVIQSKGIHTQEEYQVSSAINKSAAVSSEKETSDSPTSNKLRIDKRVDQSKDNLEVVTPCKFSPYQAVVRALNDDEHWQREITLGRRVGFYVLKNDIGSGNFSQVKSAYHQLTKEKVAVKILDRSKLDSKTHRMLNREISSMEKLHHPNVVRLFEVMETFSKIYLVTEFANGSDLHQKILSDGRLDEEDAKVIFAQIVAAVDHMHQHNIIHRDIKAENVFLTERKIIKVGDFGFAIQVTTKDDLLNTFCGSPPYAAPELFSDEKYIGASVDLWALGVLLYFITTASMPFKAHNVSLLKKLIVGGEYNIPNFVSHSCQTVIKGLLRNEPKSRLRLSNLKESPWLTNQHFAPSLPSYKILSENDENWGNNETRSDCEIEEDSEVGLLPAEDQLETFEQLKVLGISRSMVIANLDKGIRSNVIGTYRILLNRIMASKYQSNVIKRYSIGIQTNESRIEGKQKGWKKSKSKDYDRSGNNSVGKYQRRASSKSIKSIFIGNDFSRQETFTDRQTSFLAQEKPFKPVKNNFIFGNNKYDNNSGKRKKKHKHCTIL